MKHDASIVRSVVHEHAYLGPAVRLRGTVIGRSCDLRAHAAVRRRSGARRRVLRRRGCGRQPGRQGVPVQDRRGGCGRHLVDRLGEPGRAHVVRSPRRGGSRERGHHARGRDPARHGLRHLAQEGCGRQHEPRHQPGRPRAEAVDHRWAEPLRGQRRGRRARHSPADPLPSPELDDRRRDLGAVVADRPEQRRDPHPGQRGARHRRGDAAQDRAVAPA